jgi:hypothetical protein
MRLHARPDEVGAGAHDEIATHPFPDEMKVVVITPYVRAAARDRIRLLLGTIGRRTRQLH